MARNLRLEPQYVHSKYNPCGRKFDSVPFQRRVFSADRRGELLRDAAMAFRGHVNAVGLPQAAA